MKEKLDESGIGPMPRPRKANECFISTKYYRSPQLLFDEFWREGELALMFGVSGVGKSVLAVQITEALARGRNLEGFRMPIGRRKVLYVDLDLSDAQFGARYSRDTSKPLLRSGRAAIHYKFAENFYRDRPSSNDQLIEWLRAAIKANGFRVVVIDDLSAIKNTHDGTRETLKLMRDLKLLCDELNVSILALADSDEPGKTGIVGEADLGRSRVLCSVADSIFAIGRHPRKPGHCYLVQTRSKSSPIFWTPQNAPVCRLVQEEIGFLGFAFDERLASTMDDETRQLICSVKALRDAGKTYRAIADELDIPRSRAERLFKKWTPAMNSGQAEPSAQSAEPPASAGGSEKRFELAGRMREIGEYARRYLGQVPSGGEPPPPSKPKGLNVHAIPFAAGLRRRTIYDLEPGFDANGRDIYIEKKCENTGQPIIWYRLDQKTGRKVHYFRRDRTIFPTNLDAGPYL